MDELPRPPEGAGKRAGGVHGGANLDGEICQGAMPRPPENLVGPLNKHNVEFTKYIECAKEWAKTSAPPGIDCSTVIWEAIHLCMAVIGDPGALPSGGNFG